MRFIWPGVIFQFFFAGAYFTILYYLPIYFQSVKNTTPIESGVRMLAMIIPLTITAILQGVAFVKIRLATVFWISGGILCAVGSGLLYTMKQDTSIGKWIGYQILVGAGSGWAFQIATAQAQVNARPEDMSQVTSMVFCKFEIHQLLIPHN